MGLVAYLELRIVLYADGIIHHYVKQLCCYGKLYHLLPLYKADMIYVYVLRDREYTSVSSDCWCQLAFMSKKVCHQIAIHPSYEYLATLPICISVHQSLAL